MAPHFALPDSVPAVITVLGLGPGTLATLSLESLALLEAAPCVLLRTERHPAAAELRARGLAFTALDSVYETSGSIAEVYPRLVEAVLEQARLGEVVYAVPGHPLIGEESVRLLIERARDAGLPLRILPALSFLDAALAALGNAGEWVDATRLRLVDAHSIAMLPAYLTPGPPPTAWAPAQTSWRGGTEPTTRGESSWPGVGLQPAMARPPGDANSVTPLHEVCGEGPGVRQAPQSAIAPRLPALIYQVDDPHVASAAKLALMELYPDEHPVTVVRHAGIAGEERLVRVPLYELDRPAAGEYDHLTSVYVPPLPPGAKRPDFQDFVGVIARLREPDGCPWDREQTYQTLKRFVLEEAYEVLEAVDAGEPRQLCDELGDLMILVLMYARFAEEDSDFDIRDVIANVVEKLVRRHPHVFGDVTADTSEEVLKNWERIKRAERPERESVLDGVPASLPALMKATEVSKRVVRVGFEWPALDDVFGKLEEEIRELRVAVAAGDPEQQHAEIGDLLFTVANVARWLKVDPEEALRGMVARFATRFREVERLAAQAGKPLGEMGIDELDALWDQAKQTKE